MCQDFPFVLEQIKYLKLIFLAKLVKSFNTDLLELIRNRRDWYKFWLQRNWANKLLYCWSFPLHVRHEIWSKSCERRSCGLVDFVMHQSIPPAPSHPPPPPPRATAGNLPALSVPRLRNLQILLCPGAGHLPTLGPFPSFWRARGFLSEYNYTDTLLTELIRSFIDKSGKRKRLFPTYLGRSKETLLAGYYAEGFTGK